MTLDLTRRGFFGTAGSLAALPLVPSLPGAAPEGPRFKLGTITYNIGAAWDLPTLLQAFCGLAADLGAKGVKVRPNGVPKGADLARTLDQIGQALRECGKAAADHGVEIWVEVHGAVTQNPPNMRTILDACGHPAVGICWNSNPTDVKDGSIQEAFDLLKKDIRSCHINELWSGYPYRELFAGLQAIAFDRVTLMECAGVPEAPNAKTPEAAIRFMRYYRALWTELCRQ